MQIGAACSNLIETQIWMVAPLYLSSAFKKKRNSHTFEVRELLMAYSSSYTFYEWTETWLLLNFLPFISWFFWMVWVLEVNFFVFFLFDSSFVYFPRTTVAPLFLHFKEIHLLIKRPSHMEVRRWIYFPFASVKHPFYMYWMY